MRSLVQTTIIFLVVVCSQSLLAAPGDIDTTFGVIGGYTVTDLAGAQVDERPNDVAIQPDGKIVVVGYRDGAIDFTSDHLVTRFNADGSLDTTFSGDGYFTLTGVGQYGSAQAVAIQSDGKIVVAGGAGDGNSTAFIFRLEPDGDLDPTFSADGIQTVISVGTVLSMALASDGKIVASTYYNGGAFPTGYYTYVIRLNSDGTLDTSFDGDGKRLINDASSPTVHFPYGLAIQTDGRIIVAGRTSTSSTLFDVAMVRLNTNGSFDTSFDTDGIVRTQLATQESQARSVLVQSDGKIVVGGGISQPFTTYMDPGIFRYNSDGSLDTTFDADGYRIYEVIANNEDYYFNEIKRQPDGKYLGIAAGVSSYPTFNRNDFYIVRTNSDGSPDSGFDANSIVKSQWCEGAKALELQSDGAIVAVGSLDRVDLVDYEHGLCVQRFYSNGSVDNSFAAEPSTGRAIISAYGLKTVHAIGNLPSGKILAAGVGEGPSGFDAAVLTRLNSDGTLDTTFMDEGIYVRSNTSTYTAFYDLKVLYDGSFYVAGDAGTSGAMLVKFTGDGVPDTTFSGDGVTTTSNAARFFGVIVQADGKPVGCGSSGSTTRSGRVVRFTSTGSFETVTTNNMGSPGLNNEILECALQSDGKLVVAGYGHESVSDTDRVAVSRHLSTLAVDSAFGTSGVTTFDVSTVLNDRGSDLAIQGDNKILVSSTGTNGADTDMAAIRFDADGAPDTSLAADFGSGGISLIDLVLGSPDDSGNAILAQPDGQILVSGTSVSASNGRFALSKLNSGGAVAIGFGTLGRALTIFPTGSASMNAMAFFGNSKLILGGQVYGPSGPMFALARFQNEFIPTAAGATVGGQVLDADRKGVANAVVTIEGLNGSRLTTRTSAFGYFTVEGLSVGQTYVFNVRSKRHSFEPRVVSVTEDVLGLEFVATSTASREY